MGEAVDNIETDPAFYYRHGLTIEHASTLLKDVESLLYALDHKKVPFGQYEVQTAAILADLSRVVKGVGSSY